MEEEFFIFYNCFIFSLFFKCLFFFYLKIHFNHTKNEMFDNLNNGINIPKNKEYNF